MTEPNTTALDPGLRSPISRYLSCLRWQDVLVLQGTPLLGAACGDLRWFASDFAALAFFLCGNLLLVTHVFVLNDWSGLATDSNDPNKATRVFSSRGVKASEMALLSAVTLLASLAAFSRVGTVAVELALAIAALSALYSVPRSHWKGRPLLSSLVHLAGGILHFLLGYSLSGAIDARAVMVATFFALVFAAGHLTQEVRDHSSDALNGINTNAVAFGPRRTFIAGLTLFGLAQAILLGLCLNRILPPPLAAAAGLFALQVHWSLRTLRRGLTFANVSGLRSRYRLLYAIMGIAMVAAISYA